MLYNDLNCVNVSNKTEVYTTWQLKNCNSQNIFMNLIISVIYGAKFTKFGTPLVEDHSEGTVSQIFLFMP